MSKYSKRLTELRGKIKLLCVVMRIHQKDLIMRLGVPEQTFYGWLQRESMPLTVYWDLQEIGRKNGVDL